MSAGDGARASLSQELGQEIERGAWMYQWELAPGVVTPTIGANLMPVHITRAEMIESTVRQALAATPAPRVVDLACHEGWFGHRALEWGADRVLGIDIRQASVHRASLIRDHFGIPAARLEFRAGDVLELDPSALGEFDVVLVLGLIYHLERPLEALRIARALTKPGGVCVIESQLTRQDRPVVRGDGVPGVYQESPVSFAAWVEAAPDNTLASADGGVMSLVPNRAALREMPIWAGFGSVEFLRARFDHDLQYVGGDRAIVVARP